MKRAFLMLALVLLGIGCGSDGAVNEGEDVLVADECTEGEIKSCLMEDQSPGEKICTADGWSSCQDLSCEPQSVRECELACGTAGTQSCNPDGTWAPCAGQELCNNLDDDCDGQVDEDLSQQCYCGTVSGESLCAAGSWGVCSAGVASNPELCDNVDNNCNGQVDEGLTRECSTACGDGLETCSQGQWGQCDAAESGDEICNDLDDDCDGKVDEELGEISCGIGQCAHSVPACVAGEPGECDPDEGKGEEVCDQVDNDCDGDVDEGVPDCCEPGQMAECSSNTGECEKGVWTCDGSGSWGTCSGKMPTEELCDNKDNDCDGEVDNGNPEGGAFCGSDMGTCSKGTESCVDGELVCLGSIEPEDELCDGLDNDCDGLVDNGDFIDGFEAGGHCESPWDLGTLEVSQEGGYAISGTLFSAGDPEEDWYEILALEPIIVPWLSCDFFDDLCHTLTISFVPAEGKSQELCGYVENCSGSNATEPVCINGTVPMVFSWEGITLLNDDYTFFLRVLGDQSCKPYVISFSFTATCHDEDGLCPGN